MTTLLLVMLMTKFSAQSICYSTGLVESTGNKIYITPSVINLLKTCNRKHDGSCSFYEIEVCCFKMETGKI